MMHYLDKDWYGKACPKADFEITRSSNWIFKVSVSAAPPVNALAKAGCYHEGLWEQDVAEWFIVNSQTGRYLEFNLAANGAWWMMAFTQPRVRDETLLSGLEKISTDYSAYQGCWEAELKIPEECLVLILGEAGWVHNVCFILGQQPRQYMSLNKLSSKVPDFHRPTEITTRIR